MIARRQRPPARGTASLWPAAVPSPAARRSSARNAWMITFADLVALMLTFFVLLFAMSQIQQQRWQSIVESLAGDLSAAQDSAATKLAADYQVEPELLPPGKDLAYLVPILREHLASVALLAGAAVDLAADGLAVTFPGERLFADGTAELTPRGGKIVFALGGVLRNLRNAVDVNASFAAEGGAGAQDWALAMARSVAITRILVQSGFAGPTISRGRPERSDAAGSGPRRSADGIEILVREDQPEVP